MYSDNLTKIRRFLRDPDGNIWDDSFLLGLWNISQRDFLRQTKFDEQVTILMHPPHYQMSYTHDCEWANNQHANGQTYRFTPVNWQMPISCCHLWESQSLGSSTASDTVSGDRFVHPWEAYFISNPADMTPMWFPYDYHSALFVAYDEDPIEFIPFKHIASRDSNYKSYSGSPQYWTVRDDASNEFYLYPKPSAVWNTIDMTFETDAMELPLVLPFILEDTWTENADDTGMLVSTDFTDEDGDTGAVIDYSQAETTMDSGAAFSYLRSDDNVLMIYRQRAIDIENSTDEPAQPRFLQKYMEYDVLERAYRANTDGRINSLAEYWSWRKELGHKILLDFRYSRLADRNLQLTGVASSPRKTRGPRLPSTYPPV